MSAKTGAVVAVSPRFLRAKDAYEFLGSEQTLRDCEAAKWIKPAHRHHKLTLYSLSSLHACADRIEAGEYPRKPGTAKEGR